MILINEDNIKEICEDIRQRFTIVAVSGYFDPPTPAHLTYFKAAKALGDVLIVILNTDEQLLKKRCGTRLENRIRYSFVDRTLLLDEFRSVDVVVRAIDLDMSISETLRLVRPHIFAKGGDRPIESLPQAELNACTDIACDIVTGIGSDKTHSSSWYDWEDD